MTNDKGIRRTARWNFKRAFGAKAAIDGIGSAINAGVDSGKDAYSVLKPKGRLTKASFQNQYGDGGVERFKELVGELSEAEISASLAAWDRDAAIYMVAGCISLLAIPALYVFGIGSFFILSGGCIMAVISFLMALKADYRAWQIRQGRVGALGEYLNDYLPSNMQIISKDDQS